MALKMDLRQLPLNALRSFEVTGRLLNMRLAAEELGVTHGAVSHQIRALEEKLGVALFVRAHNRLDLSPQGQRYHLELRRIFAEMVRATAALDPQSLAGRLTVGCSADTAVNWLVPALAGFMRQYPEVELKLVELHPDEGLRADVEVGILNGLPKSESCTVEALCELKFFPVCAPSLISAATIPLKARGFLNYRLLHADDGSCWDQWLHNAGIGAAAMGNQLFLPNVTTMLTAARQGLGIALAEDLEVADDLKSGALIRLSGLSFSSVNGYYLITLKDSLMSDRARAFADWVRTLVDR